MAADWIRISGVGGKALTAQHANEHQHICVSSLDPSSTGATSQARANVATGSIYLSCSGCAAAEEPGSGQRCRKASLLLRSPAA